MEIATVKTSRTYKATSMSQEKVEAGKAAWQAAKDIGTSFLQNFRKGVTEEFMQSRTIGTTRLDFNNPYQKRRYTPVSAISGRTEVKQIDEVEMPAKSIANFVIHVNEQVITYSTETEFTVSIRIAIEMKETELRTGGGTFFIEIPLEEYSSLGKYLSKHHPQCLIHSEKGFAEMLAEKFLGISDRVVYRYKFGGWVRAPDRKLIFLHSGLPNVECEVYLKHNIELSKQFLPLYWQLSDNREKLLIILLFVLWAGLAKFYEQKGLESKGLRAALYLSAKSGTGKTTLLSILTKAFLREGASPCLRFEDTGPCIEENLLVKRDIPAMVDDYFAQGTRQGDADYEKKASSIMRIVGDGMLRGKLGCDRKRRPDRKYRGSLLCTGEFVSLNTHSSVLRTWQVHLAKNSIKFGVEMNYLQENTDVPRAFMAEWIKLLEDHQGEILDKLPVIQRQNEERAKAQLFGCQYARVITHTATLLTIGQLFNYFIRCLGLPEITDVSELILAQAKEQLSLVEELAPTEVWYKAIRYAVDSGRLNLAEDESAFIQNQCDGFIDSHGRLQCISGKADDIVSKIALERRYGLKITEAVKKELVEQGLIRPSSNGEVAYKYSKKRKNSPHRPRMYSIFLKEE